MDAKSEARGFTRPQMALFAAKQAGLRLRRAVQDSRSPLGRHQVTCLDEDQSVLAESRTPLFTESAASEFRLQLGKIQNLRAALRGLNGARIPAGKTFSFWKQIGRATRRRGFVLGRELREGCLIPTVGGGLCQLSNALYDLALRTGCPILERHGHTREVPGSAAEAGRDATVAWNYVDLRFRPDFELTIRAWMDADDLLVQFLGVSDAIPATKPHRKELRVLNPIGSCASCGEEACAGHRPDLGVAPVCRVAFVLNSATPEAAAYVEESASTTHDLFIPIDGRRFRLGRYAWPVDKFSRVQKATLASLLRSIRARRMKGKPPAVVRAEQLRSDERIALSLAARPEPEHVDLVVAQSFLPYLWREGFLGGRRFRVLMERLPLAELHRRLDGALARFPDQRLLGDFRAPPELVRVESEALAVADGVITAHSGIAAMFEGRVERIPWKASKGATVEVGEGRAIAFPGPTAARKGAYAVREVARRLGLPVVVLGRELEGPDFWEGVEVVRCPVSSTEWLEKSFVVLQPSISEDRPGALLKAQQAGLPIITGSMSGIGPDGQVQIVEFGDSDTIASIVASLAMGKAHNAIHGRGSSARDAGRAGV